MDEEICNTCLYYDPQIGLCVRTDEVRGAMERCEAWTDWELEFYGRKKQNEKRSV